MRSPYWYLKLSMAVWWATGVGALVLAFFLEPYLPGSLLIYLEEETMREMTLMEGMSFLIAIPLLMLLFASTIGMLYRKRWSANAFICCTFVVVLIDLPHNPYPMHTAAQMFVNINLLVSGFAIALLMRLNRFNEDN